MNHPGTSSSDPAANQSRLSIDWTKVQDVCPVESKLGEHFKKVLHGKAQLIAKNGKGSEFTGWVDFVKQDHRKLLDPILKISERISSHSDAVVVIGIGGSNLGAKAIYDALTHTYANLQLQEHQSRSPLLFWAGNNLATDALAELIDALEGTSPSLIVISKSGTTTEPALAFRVLKSYLDNRFGAAEAAARIVTVTDPESGTLRRLSRDNGWQALEIPPSVGGRYSVFTACGLLPLAAAGIDVEAFLAGARDCSESVADSRNESLENNPALCYAAVRNALYEQKYKIEALCTWTPKLKTVSEWWAQLFGESDAKGNTGLYPASASLTTDLHSLGQYFQEGERHLFATHIRILRERSLARGTVDRSVAVPRSTGLGDGFDFLQDKPLQFVQNKAQEGTFLAHADGKCPTLVWNLPERNAYWLGYWMYANMFACGAGGYARGINPFDQPGVEDYKRNMFALIGKPGLEKEQTHLLERIERGRRLCSYGPTHK